MYIEYRKTLGCKNLWDLKLYARMVSAITECPRIIAPSCIIDKYL